jgi:hypothetical protein
MYTQIDNAIPPKNINCKIWRYMDLSKFISLLEYEKLYCTRIDKFEDPFEGNWPIIDESVVLPQHMHHSKSMVRTTKIIMGDINKSRFVNCWYMDENESMAMWKIYSRQDEGIAIVSTFDKLRKSITDEREIFIGKVFYDKEKGSPGPFKVFYGSAFNKRPSFDFEKELRVVCDSLEHMIKNEHNVVIGYKNVSGILIDVNLTDLIDEVVISPVAKSWFVDLIKDVVLKRFNFRFNPTCRQSTIRS